MLWWFFRSLPLEITKNAKIENNRTLGYRISGRKFHAISALQRLFYVFISTCCTSLTLITGFYDISGTINCDTDGHFFVFLRTCVEEFLRSEHSHSIQPLNRINADPVAVPGIGKSHTVKGFREPGRSGYRRLCSGTGGYQQ